MIFLHKDSRSFTPHSSEVRWGVCECLDGYVIASRPVCCICLHFLQGERSNRTGNGIKGHHPAYQNVCMLFSQARLPCCTWFWRCHDVDVFHCTQGLTIPSALPGLKFGPTEAWHSLSQRWRLRDLDRCAMAVPCPHLGREVQNLLVWCHWCAGFWIERWVRLTFCEAHIRLH